MNLIKWILGLVALLGLVLVGGSLLLPATTHVERSVVINRAPAEVYATLNSFQRFGQWSPWAEADPDIKYSFEGPAEGVGAIMRWSGNQAVGRGSQHIVESTPPQHIKVALDFDGSQAVATYTLTTEAGGATRLTWGFDADHGFNPFGRWFGLMFERMMGPDFERGLARLKALLEQPAR